MQPRALAHSAFEYFSRATASTTVEALDIIVGIVNLSLENLSKGTVEDLLAVADLLPLYLTRSTAPPLEASPTLAYIERILTNVSVYGAEPVSNIQSLTSMLDLVRDSDLPVLNSIQQRLSDLILRSQPLPIDVEISLSDEILAEGVMRGKNESTFLIDDLVRLYLLMACAALRLRCLQ